MGYTISHIGGLMVDIFGPPSGPIILFVASVAAIVFAIRTLWRRLRETEVLKYEFISIIAHKFRTPLTGVKWSAEDLLSKEVDAYKKQSLQGIVSSNEKLIKLTGTLIEMSDSDSASKASYSLERTAMGEFTKAAVDSFKATFHEKNIFLSVQCQEPDVIAMIDRTRMDFVLQTLFENACIYSPTGRNVDIAVGSAGHKGVITVTDHGIGMDKGALEHVFSKFYRAPNAQSVDTEGFGIGLFMAQAVARRHGGKIEAYSEGIGKGSTFSVIVPLAR